MKKFICAVFTFVSILFAILHDELIPYDDGRKAQKYDEEK